MKDVLDVIKNIETIYSTNSSLSVLKDFERVIDEMDLYVYDNWIDGELVEGPIVTRHWVKASFMWPRDKMPDPMGAARLLDYNCKIQYEKTNLVQPKKVESEEDFRPGTKKGQLDRQPVWVVHITMPKTLVSDIYDGYMTQMKTEMGIGRNNRVDGTPMQPEEQIGMNTPQLPGAAEPVGTGPGAEPLAGTNNV